MLNRRSFCLSATAFATVASQRVAWSQARSSRSGSQSTAGGRVLLGVDYYPDQTPENLWAEDATRMAAAGVNNVRLAEFAWALMEPAEGQFQFDWLRRAVDLLHGRGIASILGTPSAAPPQWLSAKYPEALLVNDQGITMTPDSRRYTCPSNATYRRLSNTVATKMAEAFARHPGVIGWQIDNEFTLASFPRCYCKSCRAGFQEWVKAKYGTLEKVNAAWGTSFWSQVYTDFAQIPVPLPSAAPPNPGFALDYDRYQSDAYAEFGNQQVAILRERCPGHFLTTNNVTLAESLNQRDLYRKLDFASTDNYPAFFAMQFKTTDAQTASMIALGLDATRWTKQGAPFLVMEEQSGKSGQPTFSAQPQKGQVRLWTYQVVAHGAMGVNYFRWDTARFGAEEYWHGLLNHDRSNSPAFDEIVQTFRELKGLPPELMFAPVESEAAITFDPESGWANSIQPGQPDLRYSAELGSWYRALWSGHHSLDCVDLTDDLSRYKMVLMPLHYVLSDAQAQGARRFVEGGGHLVIGYRSGVKTEANQIVDAPRPGLLRDLAGVTVTDYVPVYSREQRVRSALMGATVARCEQWYDVLDPGKTEVLATYTEGDAAGKAAITRRRVGRGSAIYLGPRLEAEAHARVLQALAQQCGLQPLIEAGQGVEACRRANGKQRWLVILNHNETEATVQLTGSHRDLLGKRPVSGSLTLPKFGVAVLEEA